MAENIQTGIVKSVDIKTDAHNNRIISVSVQTLQDLSIIPNVVIDSPLFAQYIPVVGQLVMIQRIDNYFTKIIAYFGDKAFSAPIESGEVVIEGQGGGFVHFNNNGDVIMSDQTLSNVIRFFNSVGVTITADGFSLNVKNVGQINVTPKNSELGTDDKLELIKMAGSIPVAKISMTNDKIAVDGAKVEIGLQANPIKCGVVVSNAPVMGSHDFCLVTGQLIPRSMTVSATP